MKMVLGISLVLLLVAAGCGTSHQAELPPAQVELVEMTPFPPVKTGTYPGGLHLNVILHIMQDGTVQEARILGSSGDEEWDALAARAMQRWRFTRPMQNGKPSDIWTRQLVVVQLQDPEVMALAELTAGSQREADSLHALIDRGEDLGSLFTHRETEVNIGCYPPRVREALRKLKVNGVTPPLRVGERYVIYKRLPADAAEPIRQ